VTPETGQPPELAIRADIAVPERKLALTLSLRRNTDRSLSATHTIEITFKLPADFAPGGISNVPGILMKLGERVRGAPLALQSVKVTPSVYLMGLSDSEQDKPKNLQLLERDWFDVALVYSNRRRAIIALEKGAAGARAFEQAFSIWGQNAPRE
jgi:hypothetical protein